MNHKRKGPKGTRAGCLMCKPNKLGQGLENHLGHRGFGKLRDERAAEDDMSNLRDSLLDVQYLEADAAGW